MGMRLRPHHNHKLQMLTFEMFSHLFLHLPENRQNERVILIGQISEISQ